MVVLAVLAVIVFIIVIASIKIVRQSTAVVVERLGKFHRLLNTGIHFIFPFIDKAVGGPISLKERVADFAPQPVITKDNVTMQIDTVVYFQVTAAFFASARKIIASFSPSATSMLLRFSPSAFKMLSRLSRSALICFSIAC